MDYLVVALSLLFGFFCNTKRLQSAGIKTENTDTPQGALAAERHSTTDWIGKNAALIRNH
ncbi:hypothetical protein D0C16_16665 [Cellvibrio sp. KY-GH-1]|nr:hypothetical protein D0C16_16665 [Cellvibrio sp. KY-GH-1]